MKKTTIRLPEHLLSALAQEATRNNMSLSAMIRVTLAKALNLPLDTGDSRSFNIRPSLGIGTSKTILVPYHLVWQAKAQVQQGLVIQAIKDLRAALDIGLYEAKSIVDILRDEGT